MVYSDVLEVLEKADSDGRHYRGKNAEIEGISGDRQAGVLE